jgi:hypothetical protein
MVACEGVTLAVDLGALNVIGMSVRSLISAFVPAPGVHGRCCTPVIDVATCCLVLGINLQYLRSGLVLLLSRHAWDITTTSCSAYHSFHQALKEFCVWVE